MGHFCAWGFNAQPASSPGLADSLHKYLPQIWGVPDRAFVFQLCRNCLLDVRKVRLGAQGPELLLLCTEIPQGPAQGTPGGELQEESPNHSGTAHTGQFYTNIPGHHKGSHWPNAKIKFCSLWFLFSPNSPHFCDSLWECSVPQSIRLNLEVASEGSPREDEAAGKEQNTDS